MAKWTLANRPTDSLKLCLTEQIERKTPLKTLTPRKLKIIIVIIHSYSQFGMINSLVRNCVMPGCVTVLENRPARCDNGINLPVDVSVEMFVVVLKLALF